MLAQPRDIPGLIAQQIGRADRNQLLGKQVDCASQSGGKCPLLRSTAQSNGSWLKSTGVDVHPGAGQLHFVARLQMPKATEPRQQPAHGQGRRGFHAQDVVFGAQGIAGALQGSEALANARQQQPRRLGELQIAATAVKQAGRQNALRAYEYAD